MHRALHRVYRFVQRVNNSALVHGFLMIVWTGLVIPTMIWWRESIAWVGFMSLYAIIVSHAGALEGALAKAIARENSENG